VTRALRAERVKPLSGEASSAVIFLHGYGANGRDLIGLAEPLAEHMPDTLFLSPDAPEECVGSPLGLQWFPIPWIDGSSEEMARNGVLRAVDDLQAFLDGIMVDEDLLPEQVMLFGFSQGSMMALHAAPRGSGCRSCRVLWPAARARAPGRRGRVPSSHPPSPWRPRRCRADPSPA
jgi:phospholipase/carboxylesterase